MKNFTPTAPRVYLGLLLKIIICLLWLLCIVSAARAAPGFGQQPATQSVCSGTNVSFTITVTGTSGSFTIRWQESINSGPFNDITDGGSYSGATTVTLTLTSVTVGNHNGRAYRCKVTEGTTETFSTAANLTVNQTPAVDPVGTSKFICVDARNSNKTAPFVPGGSYQWQVSTNNGGSWANVLPADGYLGSTTNTLTYPQIKLSMNGYLYRYRVTVGTCSNTSIAVDTLHTALKPAWAAPLPGDAFTDICPGDDITFADSATGVTPILYRWQISPNGGTYTDIVDNAVFSGSQTKRLQITDFPGVEGSINFIRLKATYPAPYLVCDVNTGASQLTVRELPAVSVPPADVTTCANTNTEFSVSGTGTELLNYQWQTDNGSAGATWTNVGTNADRLPVNGVTTAMNGWKYRVTVSNDCSPPATSNAVTLTVRRLGIWFGTLDTKWEEAQNWCGGLPDNTIDVLVPNVTVNGNMPVISGSTNTAFFKSLEIENAARLTISGGIVNNMTGPFNLLGTVAYTATGNQEIFPANHGSLEINGSGNKALSSNVNISHNLVLGGSAKLVTRTNYLTMKTGSNPVAASALSASATSWIVTGNGSAGAGNTGIGGLRIEQIDATDGAVLYPIGPTPAAYNPIRLTNTGTVDNFTVAVNDQLIPGGIFDAGINRTWLVAETTPGSSNVTLAVKWLGSEEHTAFDRTQTQIIRSNGTQIVETSSKAPANIAGGGIFTSVDGNFSILTQFSVASTVSVLPVELKSFTAQKTVNAAVGLTWTTPGNETAKYFNIQRSTDGLRFANIGMVNGETGKTAYNYIDNLPGTGVIYYRLQVASQQDKMVYSGIQSVVLNNANLIQLRPSATTGTMTNVYMHTAAQTVINLTITDISGRIHDRQSLQLTKGEHLLPLWIGGLNKGVYYVHVKDEKGNVSVLTLVKQ